MKGNFYPHELINVYNDKYLLLEMNQNLMLCCDRREVQEFRSKNYNYNRHHLHIDMAFSISYNFLPGLQNIKPDD
jgi:hypothetical protein